MPETNIYWHRTRRLTVGLFIIWVFVTFVMSWFSRELNELEIFGFPLGFYMSAQGVLFIYLAMIWFYNRRMRKLDAEYGINDQ